MSSSWQLVTKRLKTPSTKRSWTRSWRWITSSLSKSWWSNATPSSTSRCWQPKKWKKCYPRPSRRPQTIRPPLKLMLAWKKPWRLPKNWRGWKRRKWLSGRSKSLKSLSNSTRPRSTRKKRWLSRRSCSVSRRKRPVSRKWRWKKSKSSRSKTKVKLKSKSQSQCSSFYNSHSQW